MLYLSQVLGRSIRDLEGERVATVKDVIVQFAKGDKTVPNPTNTALLRAGNLSDRATYYRYDLVFPTFDAREMAVSTLGGSCG